MKNRSSLARPKTMNSRKSRSLLLTIVLCFGPVSTHAAFSSLLPVLYINKLLCLWFNSGNCVCRESQVRAAILDTRGLANRQRIDICVQSNIEVLAPMDVEGAKAELNCLAPFFLSPFFDNLGFRFLETTWSCKFDADEGGTRVFVNSPLEFAANGILFKNAQSDTDGAVMMITSGSAHFEDCLFRNNDATENGGALSAMGTDTSLTLENCEFKSNTALLSGGAISIKDGATLQATEVSFHANVASADDEFLGGGAIFATGTSSTLVLNNCNFTSSTVGDGEFTGEGGAILLQSGATASGTKLRFTGNSAGVAGGAIVASGADTKVLMTDTAFMENKSGKDAGALRVSDSAMMSGTNLLFENNVAGSDGGAIDAVEAVGLGILDSVFIGNTAGSDGGAIYFDSSTVLDQAQNLQFLRNTATRGVGGALAVIGSATQVDMINVVMEENTSGDRGGALFVQSSKLMLTTASFASNSAPSLENGRDIFINDDGDTKQATGGGSLVTCQVAEFADGTDGVVEVDSNNDGLQDFDNTNCDNP